jgi:hypothetical protein
VHDAPHTPHTAGHVGTGRILAAYMKLPLPHMTGTRSKHKAPIMTQAVCLSAGQLQHRFSSSWHGKGGSSCLCKHPPNTRALAVMIHSPFGCVQTPTKSSDHK